MNLYEYQRSRSFIDLGPRSHRFNILKPFSLETAEPIEAKFHVKPSWDGGMKIYSNDHGHMINMAAIPIYGKGLKKTFSSGIERPMTLNIGGIQHRVLEYYQVCSNDNPGLTLTYFKARSNLVPYAFGGARWLSGRVSDSGARGPGFETYRRRVVSLSKTLYSPKVLVNYPGSDGSVPT